MVPEEDSKSEFTQLFYNLSRRKCLVSIPSIVPASKKAARFDAHFRRSDNFFLSVCVYHNPLQFEHCECEYLHISHCFGAALGRSRPKCVVRRLGLSGSFRQSKPFTQREVVRQQCDRYAQFSWPVALYESRSPFTLGRIENYRKPDETLCQYAEQKMVANVAAVPIADKILRTDR